jgi:hypothetical protein
MSSSSLLRKSHIAEAVRKCTLSGNHNSSIIVLTILTFCYITRILQNVATGFWEPWHAQSCPRSVERSSLDDRKKKKSANEGTS